MNRPTPKTKLGNEFFSGEASKKLLGASTSYIVDVRRLTKPLETLWQPLETKILRHISKRYFLI